MSKKTLKVDALVAEIGSTTTLVSAFSNLESAPAFLGQGMGKTTAHLGDVTLGLTLAMRDLQRRLNVQELEYDTMLAASSAAGGLSMSVHGLVYDMTARAAKMAALGAGAVVRQVTAGRLSEMDLHDLKALRPNLILLAGGTDYGEKETILYNARAIAGLGLAIPVICAGNVQAANEVKAVFAQSGQPLTAIENVYPRLDELNVEPARRAIQDLFETHIVKAPGMSKIRTLVKGAILPTPGAVMEAVRLLHPHLGDLVCVDVGGATTDVHSAAQGSQEVASVQTQPEPYFKRTVEGDLGTGLNAMTLAGQAGLDRLSRELGGDAGSLLAAWPTIPENEQQEKLATLLSREAGLIALRRHAGAWRQVFLPEGRRMFAEGKDLSEATTLVVTGGALTQLPHRDNTLTALRDANIEGRMLYPKPGVMRVLLDAPYLMAALGVLSRAFPEAATQLLKECLVEVTLP